MAEEDGVPKGSVPEGAQRARRPFRWFRDNLLQVLGLLGIFSYALNRVAYGLFYGRLGLSPQDVGIRQDDIAAQLGGVLISVAAVAVGTFYLALIVFMLVYIVRLFLQWLAIVRVLLRMLARPLRDAKTGQCLLRWAGSLERFAGTLRSFPRRYWKSALSPLGLVLVLALGGAVMCGYVINQSVTAFDHAQRGQRVDAFRELSSLLITLRAQPATITPIDGRSGPVVTSNCVLYLGAADGLLSVYDHRSESTVLLAAEGVRVDLQASKKSC